MSQSHHPEAHRGDRVVLDRAELIDIAGADAIAFAHAQFSSDVAALGSGEWQWSAWLSAKGRARAVFVLLRVADDRLLAWLPLGGAQAIRDALAHYVLRAKVRLVAHEDWALGSLPGAAFSALPARAVFDRDGGHAFAQPGPEPRAAWLGPAPALERDPRALERWRLADIAAGLPWIAPATQDAFVPQALDLERLDAIRFDKGCFPGQEIAARLHFRGGARQRLRRVILRGDGGVSPGLRIEAAGVPAGIVLYGVPSGPQTHQALAVMHDVPSVDAPRASTSGHAIEIVYDTFS